MLTLITSAELRRWRWGGDGDSDDGATCHIRRRVEVMVKMISSKKSLDGYR